MSKELNLLKKVGECTLCAPHLPLAAKPVFQLHSGARILVAGQAPGLKAHISGIPFNDASGKRLRGWMGVDDEFFYDQTKVAILPMGLCYPGSAKSGDLPPSALCANQWRKKLLSLMPHLQLTLVIGYHAQDWHLAANRKQNLTETVKSWKTYWPTQIPLPHPSPRNNGWLKRNPWFESDVLPILRKQIRVVYDE